MTIRSKEDLLEVWSNMKKGSNANGVSVNESLHDFCCIMESNKNEVHKAFLEAHSSAYSGTSRGKLVESVMCDKCAGTQ